MMRNKRMKYRTRIFAVSAFFVATFVPKAAFAHCPLCTAGAVAVGLGAYELGMSTFSVGIGIGAFALALGLWFAKLPKRQYIPFQFPIIVIAIFVSTILPIIPFMPGAFGLYLSSVGEYGLTLVASRFLLGSLVGALVIALSPAISRGATRISGRHVSFQGVITTILLLAIVVGISEIIL